VKKAFRTFVLLLVAAPSFGAEEKIYPSHLMVDQEVVVTARITGIVDSVAVDRGAVVKQGQTLATLDTRELDADVREAKEDMELKKAEFQRSESLAASKVGSAQDLDEKRAQYQVATARWEKAKTLRDYAVIRAPFGGVITEKYARVGQKVIEDRTEPLFKVTATEPLLARLYLPEEETRFDGRGLDPPYALTSLWCFARNLDGVQRLTLHSKAKPLFAGVDPYNYYVDRNSDDNLVAVTAG